MGEKMIETIELVIGATGAICLGTGGYLGYSNAKKKFFPHEKYVLYSPSLLQCGVFAVGSMIEPIAIHGGKTTIEQCLVSIITGTLIGATLGLIETFVGYGLGYGVGKITR